MSVNLNQDGSLTITTMSLIELLPEVEKAIHLGFMLDVDNNLGVPQQLGHIVTVTMFPAGEVQVQDVDNNYNGDEFVITHGTNLSEVTQPAGEEAEKALQEAVQETAVSTKDAQTVKVDKRKKS